MGIKWNLSVLWGKITYPFSRFFHWVVKTAQYSKLLWNDFDWDYSYILILLQYKLKRTRERILDNNIVVSAEQIAAEIKHAEDLIQNWRDDNFCEDLYEAHEKKWGKIISRKERNKDDQVDGDKPWDWFMRREKATTLELHDQERKEYMAIHQQADKAKEENFDELFRHLRDHIQRWWD